MAAPALSYFPLKHRQEVKNPAKVLLMMPNGELHPYVYRWLCEKYRRNSMDWHGSCLEEVFWDIELQMKVQDTVIRSSIVFVCLLNVHKKMLMWTQPDIYRNGRRDTACHMDLIPYLEPLIVNCIMSGCGLEPYFKGIKPSEDPHILDQAFATKLDHVLWTNQFEGSSWQIWTWVSPRDLKPWFHGRFLKQPHDIKAPDYMIPELPLPPQLQGVSYLGPLSAINIWRRPADIDSPEASGLPRYSELP